VEVEAAPGLAWVTGSDVTEVWVVTEAADAGTRARAEGNTSASLDGRSG